MGAVTQLKPRGGGPGFWGFGSRTEVTEWIEQERAGGRTWLVSMNPEEFKAWLIHLTTEEPDSKSKHVQ